MMRLIMQRSERIIIVGGGIGGMTAAAALAQAGFPVTLLEAAPAFGDIGAGVTLSPNALKGFDHIGVCEAVAAAGVEPVRQRIQHWEDGRTLVPMERASAREKYGAPYVTIHRADLHAILVGAAEKAGADLQTGAAVERIEGSSAVFSGGRIVEGDVIIGADGLKSVVRQLFEPVSAHFTGHVAWRALVPVTAPLQAITDWPGVHIGPGRMITRYPVRGGTLLNLVFFARQEGWNDEGWSIPASSDDLAETFSGWCDEVQAMIDAASRVPLYKWAINARGPLADWSREGRIALLGDAAHAMTPFLGHGAACAIEDAVVLARAMAASHNAAEGLARYVSVRHDRATFIQAESAANADRMQSADSALFGLDKMRDEESLGLFDYDCRTVAV
jgi:salicylate hydroxylase